MGRDMPLNVVEYIAFIGCRSSGRVHRALHACLPFCSSTCRPRLSTPHHIISITGNTQIGFFCLTLLRSVCTAPYKGIAVQRCAAQQTTCLKGLVSSPPSASCPSVPARRDRRRPTRWRDVGRRCIPSCSSTCPRASNTSSCTPTRMTAAMTST